MSLNGDLTRKIKHSLPSFIWKLQFLSPSIPAVETVTLYPWETTFQSVFGSEGVELEVTGCPCLQRALGERFFHLDEGLHSITEIQRYQDRIRVSHGLPGTQNKPVLKSGPFPDKVLANYDIKKKIVVTPCQSKSLINQ